MEKVAQNVPKSGGETSQGDFEGATLKPPTLQLQASTGSGVVQAKTTPKSPGINTLQKIANGPPVLKISSDAEMWQIIETDEWQILSDPAQKWQTDYMLSYEQVLDVCYAIIQKFIDKSTRTWEEEALDYVPKALLVKSKEEKDSEKAGNISTVGFLRPQVDDFAKDVKAAKTVAEIRVAVEKHGPLLWTTSVKMLHNPKTPSDNSDAPIYLARNEMRKILRTNSVLGVPANLLEMQKLIQLLEDNSRGAKDIKGFDTAAKSKLKRVLVTGFDPFDSGATNPSGIVAQRLDGETVTYGQDAKGGPGANVGFIQSMTFPVRFDDFDKGMVERLVEPWLADVDLIFTISLAEGSGKMSLDRFAANPPRSFYDNGGIQNAIMTTAYMEQTNSRSTGKANKTRITPLLPAKEFQRIGNEIFDELVKYHSQKGTVPPIPMTAGKPAVAEVPATAGKPAVPAVAAVPPESDLDTFAKLIAYIEGPVAKFYQQVYANHFQPQNSPGDEFIESNMELGKMIDDKDGKNGKNRMPESARVNQKYAAMDDNGQLITQSGIQFANSSAEMSSTPPATVTPTTSTPSTTPVKTAPVIPLASTPKPGDTAVSGSGGNFLSNEIYHRVSTLRVKSGKPIRNVHIHIPSVGEKDANNVAFTTDRLVTEVRQIIGTAAQHNP
jgi:pyrrolidone-carboxylate peptidase